MNQLVIHQRVHALARSPGFECQRQWGNVENEQVARRRNGERVAVILAILQVDADGRRRSPAEHAALPLERVGEGAYRVRD